MSFGLTDPAKGRVSRSDIEDTDHLRVQRSEEKLRVGAREREAGRLRVTKARAYRTRAGPGT